MVKSLSLSLSRVIIAVMVDEAEGIAWVQCHSGLTHVCAIGV